MVVNVSASRRTAQPRDFAAALLKLGPLGVEDATRSVPVSRRKKTTPCRVSIAPNPTLPVHGKGERQLRLMATISSFSISHISATSSKHAGNNVSNRTDAQFLWEDWKFMTHKEDGHKMYRPEKINNMGKNLFLRPFHTRREIYAVRPRGTNEAVAPTERNTDAGFQEKVSKYSFRTEKGGQVKVSVRPKGLKYEVSVEVSSLPSSIDECDLFLNWGMFRSDSSSWLVPELESLPPEATHVKLENGQESVQMLLKKKASHIFKLDLFFDAKRAPLYLSFVLHLTSHSGIAQYWIRNHLRQNFCVPVGIGRGYPYPLGVSFNDGDSANFSLFSRNAKNVILCLYGEKTNSPSIEIELDPYINRTGDIWHVSVELIGRYASYGYRCKGDILLNNEGRFHVRRVLLDPYAKIIGNFNNGESSSHMRCLGSLHKELAFDWHGDIRPNIPMEELVVYRLNVQQFTEDRSSQLPAASAGTFVGIIEKIHHLKKLGVNAVLLEPIFPFVEDKGSYFPYHYFCPENSLGPEKSGISSSNAMKTMVKALHAHGIEVLLEVVFTRTAEGGSSNCLTISYRGIDHSSYYITERNTKSEVSILNCKNPVVQNLILDSLQHWVTDYHIDGFCFLNVSSVIHDPSSGVLTRSPLVESIAHTPILSNIKLIADSFSPFEMSSEQISFPHWRKWAEMNPKFCYDVRNFLRGQGLLGSLATRVSGSGDIFSDGRGPGFSFNFVSRSFGLPLVDLVSFSDGNTSAELSWNCGEEGATNKTKVLEIRLKQVRNFLFILYLSLGVPVLNMGDEYGQSTGGSPFYNKRKPFDWNGLLTDYAIQICNFISFLTSLRKAKCEFFQKRNFTQIESMDWHDSNLNEPLWQDPSSMFLAVTLKNVKSARGSNLVAGDLHVALNAAKTSIMVDLPHLPEKLAWSRLVDTALPYPDFFSMGGSSFVRSGKREPGSPLIGGAQLVC